MKRRIYLFLLISILAGIAAVAEEPQLPGMMMMMCDGDDAGYESGL